MIQITEGQFQTLKMLVEKAEPCSMDSQSPNGHYYYNCCDKDSRHEHAEDCPKTAWNKLESFLLTLELE